MIEDNADWVTPHLFPHASVPSYLAADGKPKTISQSPLQLAVQMWIQFRPRVPLCGIWKADECPFPWVVSAYRLSAGAAGVLCVRVWPPVLWMQCTVQHWPCWVPVLAGCHQAVSFDSPGGGVPKPSLECTLVALPWPGKHPTLCDCFLPSTLFSTVPSYYRLLLIWRTWFKSWESGIRIK